MEHKAKGYVALYRDKLLNDKRFCIKKSVALSVVLGAVLYLPGAIACTTANWSAIVDAGTNIDPSINAGLEADCGLIVNIDAANPAYVVDSTPGTLAAPAVSEYVARFYLAQNGLILGAGEELVVFEALDASSGPVFELVLRDDNGVRKLKLVAYENGGAAVTNMGSELTLADGWRAIQVSWGSGSGTGSLALKVDGVAAAASQNLANLTNDTLTVSSVRLGVVNPAPAVTLAGSSGNVMLDAFQSYRQGDAGTIDKNCSGDSVLMKHITFLPGHKTCVGTSAVQTGALLTIDSGADVTVISPQVNLQPGFSVPAGGAFRVMTP
jgi:hypothetical protein